MSGGLVWAGTALGLSRVALPDCCKKVEQVGSFDIYGYLSITLPAFQALRQTTISPPYLNMKVGNCGPMTRVDCSPCSAESNTNLINCQHVAYPQRTDGSLWRSSARLESSANNNHGTLRGSMSRISNNIDGCLPIFDLQSYPP
jgi:hypothetical protein